MSGESRSLEFVFIAVSRRTEEVGLKRERENEGERGDLTANDAKSLFKALPTAQATDTDTFTS